MSARLLQALGVQGRFRAGGASSLLERGNVAPLGNRDRGAMAPLERRILHSWGWEGVGGLIVGRAGVVVYPARRWAASAPVWARTACRVGGVAMAMSVRMGP